MSAKPTLSLAEQWALKHQQRREVEASTTSAIRKLGTALARMSGVPVPETKLRKYRGPTPLASVRKGKRGNPHRKKAKR